jgi:5,6-dimethylbenzimidazole synthase
MEFYEVIEKRRTIRIFKQGASEAQLRKILSTGAKAPSSQNKQSWEFIVVNDPQLVARVAELKYQLNSKLPPGPGETQQDVETKARNQQKWFQNASVVAVCSRTGDVATGWLAVENISLAAVAEGLGSGIIGFGGEEKKALEALLGLPEGYELICIMKMGVPEAEAKKPAQRPEFSWLHQDRF